jgi:tetratricopeptide (TPR) repeat protein
LYSEIEQAKSFFYAKKYNVAQELFVKLGMGYEAGLCSFLLNKMHEAKKIWENIKSPCIGTSWGLIALDLINLKPDKRPSYLQVRAFYEVYLNLLIENNFLKYAENLINVYPTLIRSNCEIFKFIARALFANGYYDLSMDFIAKSKQVEFFDPEAIFISSQINCIKRRYSDAIADLDEILNKTPYYFPAIYFKRVILDLKSKGQNEKL